MQAFFVKKGTATKLTFNKEMQIDGNFPTPPEWPPANSNNSLMLTAQNEVGLSKANVVMGEGQNVETLFDTNLANVPMVYTVADGQAVSINHTNEVNVIGFGVVCNSQNAVEVTLTGVDNVDGGLYVVDAVSGMKTEVTEGQKVTLLPNEYGRYFLTHGATTGIMEQQMTEGIIIAINNGLVTVSASRPLGTIRAMSDDGATAYHATDCGTTAQFPLRQGVYVIQADGAAGQKTMKIFVR
jgi:hypothetical protein